MGFYVGLFFYMSRASLLWGYAAPLWTLSGTLQTQISTVAFFPLPQCSEQFQAACNIIDHLLLSHDGQHSARAWLHLSESSVLYQFGREA